ncbi:MAG: response regulator [Campylobacteraceae bacterium]|jgi:DNA-binding NtrC family response regulator|nr:response regulator [Campylobacteraceae bacterium]MBT5491489.1 response regulator [bacterium]MBT3882387.1 response regulator [Campylobacteraceae bacterium]MBT4030306.1 response regulator [Campylobacteraceae bacterium]MBT4179478.1 response regulator [Campylobacteraceae bacterium]
MSINKSPKVMCIDDEIGLLEVYEDILTPSKIDVASFGLDALSALLDNNYDGVIDNKSSATELINFDVRSFTKGSEAIVEFEKIFLDEDTENIGVCIIDMRMPNDLNGFDTALKIKEIDPNINIIISTAYSDKKSEEFIEHLKDNIYYVKKPADPDELYQLVYSLAINYCQRENLIKTSKELDLSKRSLESLIITIENFMYADNFDSSSLQKTLEKTKKKRSLEYNIHCNQEEFWF